MNKENYIAFSLPTHNLKCHLMGESTKETEYDDDPTPKVFTITTVDYQSYCDNMLEITCVDDEHMNFVPLDEIFLLLRPLSDLTKEITHNGEKFIPIEWLKKYSIPLKYEPRGIKTIDDLYSSYNETTMSDYLILLQKLIEWEFDVGGLIELKEAIDINTLKFNPYE